MEAKLAKEAPSPFFQGTKLQYAWDSTSLGALKKCPRYYQYSILEGWRAKDESVHLTFGSCYASALETYHKLLAAGAEHDDALDSVVDLTLQRTWIKAELDEEGNVLSPAHEWLPDHNAKTRMNLIRSIVWYLEEFKDDPAKTLILADGKPAVELSFKFNSGITCEYGEFILCGHMDKLVDYGGDLYVMDQKTTGSTLGSYYFKNYNPDNQMTLYTLAGRIVYNTPVAGVIIDAAQIAVGFTSFARGITTRSEGQLEEFLGDFKLWTDVAALYAKADHWPMNEASCGNYGGCAFREICGKDSRVRELFLKTSFEKRYWNPLSNR